MRTWIKVLALVLIALVIIEGANVQKNKSLKISGILSQRYAYQRFYNDICLGQNPGECAKMNSTTCYTLKKTLESMGWTNMFLSCAVVGQKGLLTVTRVDVYLRLKDGKVKDLNDLEFLKKIRSKIEALVFSWGDEYRYGRYDLIVNKWEGPGQAMPENCIILPNHLPPQNDAMLFCGNVYSYGYKQTCAFSCDWFARAVCPWIQQAFSRVNLLKDIVKSCDWWGGVSTAHVSVTLNLRLPDGTYFNSERKECQSYLGMFANEYIPMQYYEFRPPVLVTLIHNSRRKYGFSVVPSMSA